MPSHRLAAALLAGFALTVPAAFLDSAPAAAADSKAPDSKIKDWKAAAGKVDDLIGARWRTQKDLVVAPMADDAEFLRRASIDLIGTIPTEAEAAAFLKDPATDKRARAIDRLLAEPKHAEWSALWYSNLLVGSQVRDRNLNRRTFNDWLRDQFARNRPYDEMAYDLITATGNSDENGAVGLLSSFERSAADAAGKVSRYFLGVQIQCAQCHDHPYDKRIKQAEFSSFAAFFVTTTNRRNMSPTNPGEVSFDIGSFTKEDVTNPAYRGMGMARRGAPLMLEVPAKGERRPVGELPDAKFLLGKVIKDVPGISRREILAKWMTSKNNEWFAQAFSNRLWAYYMGHGIVHPVDDFSQANAPTNPALLKFLADELVRGGFDVQHLTRVILNTEAYQRSSRMPRGLERPESSLYAVAAVKPLSVEQSFDSLFRAAGAEQEVARRLGGGMGMGGDAMKRRGQLVDPKMLIYAQFKRSFDDDEQGESEEFTGTIPRGLLMMNGPQINQMLSAHPMSPLRKILDSERSDRERVRRVYLTVLTREPSPGELSNALQHVHTSRTEVEGYEDLMWALCNTTEFMSNH